MVNNVTSLTGNGLKDWLIQRATAVYIGAYVIFLVAYLMLHPALDYQTWHHLFSCTLVKVASVLVVFAIALHAWIGIWTVATDYIKCAFVRVSMMLVLIAYLSGLLIWAIHIFWGVGQ